MRYRINLLILFIPNFCTLRAKLHNGLNCSARGFSFSRAVIELRWLRGIVRKEHL